MKKVLLGLSILMLSVGCLCGCGEKGDTTTVYDKPDERYEFSTSFGTINGKEYITGWTVGDFRENGLNSTDAVNIDDDYTLKKYNRKGMDEDNLKEYFYVNGDDQSNKGYVLLYSVPNEYTDLDEVPVSSYEVSGPLEDVDIEWSGLKLGISTPEDIKATYGEPVFTYAREEDGYYLYMYEIDYFELTFVCGKKYTSASTLSSVRLHTPHLIDISVDED